MKVFFTVLIIVLSSVFNGQGQVPGYLGNKFSVGYENRFMSSVTSPNKNYEKGALALNVHHLVDLNYVIAKKISVGLTGGYLKTGVPFKETAEVSFEDLPPDRDNPLYFEPNAYGDITDLSLTAKVRLFNTEMLAPLGNYSELGISVHNFTLTYDKADFAKSHPSKDKVKYALPAKEEHNFTKYGLHCMLGRKRVLFDYLYLDYGIQFGWVIGSYLKALEEPSFGDIPDNKADKQEYLESKTTVNGGGPFTFNFKIGIGYLPF